MSTSDALADAANIEAGKAISAAHEAEKARLAARLARFAGWEPGVRITGGLVQLVVGDLPGAREVWSGLTDGLIGSRGVLDPAVVVLARCTAAEVSPIVLGVGTHGLMREGGRP